MAITHVHIDEHLCFRDLTLKPTMTHLILGPSNSGKSQLLKAIETAPRYCTVSSDSLQHGGGWGKFTYVKFNPTLIKERVPVISNVDACFPEGYRLAAALNQLAGDDYDMMRALTFEMHEVFPEIHHIGVKGDSAGHLYLFHRVGEGNIEIDAQNWGSGITYYLAFLSLLYFPFREAFLIDAPETGFHPTMLPRILSIFRRLNEKGTQVIFCSSNPVWFGLMDPAEVTIIAQSNGITRAAAFLDGNPHRQPNQ